ncbi:hypothetical protein N7512_002321 [Penicillium capsulatum]|nr:hypothetical protein N7512_002321 [Penicillium capsulatum]
MATEPMQNSDVNGASDPAISMSEDDQRLHNVGVAALAALSQYPQAINEESNSLLVSEVVRAVTGGALTSPYFHSPTLETDEESHFETEQPRSGHSNTDTFSSETQETDHDVDMENIVHDLLERAATWNHMATVANDGDYDSIHKEMVMDYEPTFDDDYASPSSGSDDDLEDLLRFYPGEEEYYRQRNAPRSPESTMDDFNLDEFYNTVSFHTPNVNLSQNQGLAIPPEGPLAANTEPQVGASVLHTTTYERNLSIDEFIQRWMVQSNILPHGVHPDNRPSPQIRHLSKMMDWKPPPETHRPRKYREDVYDLQQIPWKHALKVNRSDARSLRDAWYTSYHNLDYSRVAHAQRLPRDESYFREKSMHTAYKASVEHFQLRNLMSVSAYNTVHFASRSQILSWTPALNDVRYLIDLTRASPESGFHGPVKISSMKSALGLTIAGGFCGEYALRASDAEGSGAKGLVTPDFNDGITNHVDIIPSRSGPSPICVFASNDRHVRVLDCETNLFLSDQELSRPINCTATSPDGRLRVVIGDSPDAWVIEADTGRPVHPLRGHRDFGFACAWSPDMRHIATSNQDKTVIIWDARTWRPLETIDSDVAGYRSLRFSPVGGGPRTLLCSEPADRISIIDAQLYQTRQVHDFFGEIGGADYSPDGGRIWVANTDPHFGGFMQYERRQWGRSFGLTDFPNEWVREAELDSDARCALSSTERPLRFLRNLTDLEHESFIL